MDNLTNFATMEFDSKIDFKVEEELKLAGIPVFTLPSYMETEVKTRYIGILNGFVFYRAWRYWVCHGNMPLGHAKVIYANHKDLAIRAGGHCGNVPPAEVAINPSYLKALEEHLNNVGFDEYNKTKDSIIEDTKQPRFVDSYHIDTLLGLQTLANYIKTNNIFTKIQTH